MHAFDEMGLLYFRHFKFFLARSNVDLDSVVRLWTNFLVGGAWVGWLDQWKAVFKTDSAMDELYKFKDLIHNHQCTKISQ